MTDELYYKLVCALTHDMSVCQMCKKCDGNNFAEIRVNLVKELKKEMKIEWSDETDNDSEIQEETKNVINKKTWNDLLKDPNTRDYDDEEDVESNVK